MVMVVKALTYEEIALADPSRQWEMHDGRLREKPPMSDAHNVVIHRLDHQLVPQLDFAIYDIRLNLARVRRDERHYYIPDLAVIPVPSLKPLLTRTQPLEVITQPLPLVVEAWSPSTGRVDLDEKLPHYMARGDLEIWHLHPYEMTLTAWRRQPDGTYTETVLRSGKIQLWALPSVTIDLDRLFA
jgi:Uma2 family endonuclease